MKRDELLKPGEYGSTPDAVMRDRRISCTAKCVYTAILSHLRGDAEWVWPSIATLAKATATGVRSVIRATEQLEAVKLIERKPYNRSTAYHFLPLPVVTNSMPAAPETPQTEGSETCQLGTGDNMAHSANLATTSAKMALYKCQDGTLSTLNETLKEANSEEGSLDNPQENSPEEEKNGKAVASNQEPGAGNGKSEESGSASSLGTGYGLPATPSGNGWHHVVEQIGTANGQKAFAEVIVKFLRLGKGDGRQLAGDRATFRRVARHISAGNLGEPGAAVEHYCKAADNVAGDRTVKTPGSYFTGIVKRDLKKAGKQWENVE